MAKIPMTLAEEVDFAVREWYAVRGQKVPKEDLDGIKAIYEEEKRELAEFKKLMAQPVKETPVKPAYGTPEFWKEWWAKKRAKEAELRAAGLPIPEPKKKKSPVNGTAKGLKEASATTEGLKTKKK